MKPKTREVLVVEYNPVGQIQFRFSDPVVEGEFIKDWLARHSAGSFNVTREVVLTLGGIEKKIRSFEERIGDKTEKILILIVKSHGTFPEGNIFVNTNESYAVYKQREDEMLARGVEGSKNDEKEIEKKEEEENEEEGELEIVVEEGDDSELFKSEEDKKKALVLHDKLFFWPEFVLNEVVFGDDFLDVVKDKKTKAVARSFLNRLYKEIGHESFRYTYKQLIRDDKIFYPTVFDVVWKEVVESYNIDKNNEKDSESVTQLYSSLRQRIKDKFLFAPNYTVGVEELIDGIKEVKFRGLDTIFGEIPPERKYEEKYVIFSQTHGYKFKNDLRELYRKRGKLLPFTPFSCSVNLDESEDKIEYYKVVGSFLRNAHCQTYELVDFILKLEEKKREYLKKKLKRFIEKFVNL